MIPGAHRGGYRGARIKRSPEEQKSIKSQMECGVWFGYLFIGEWSQGAVGHLLRRGVAGKGMICSEHRWLSAITFDLTGNKWQEKI